MENHNPSQADRGDSGSATHLISMLTGPFGILRSPLFYVASVTVMFVSWLAFEATRSLLVAISCALGLELLVSMLIWQFLIMANRTQALTQRFDRFSATMSEWAANGSRSAHGYTHRLIGELGGDQARILQSNEETRTVLRLFSEHLDALSGHLDQLRIGQETLEESQARLAETLTLLLRESGQSADGLRQVADFSEDGANGVVALEVATALDRLNLEVRRQLAALREELRGD